MKNSLNRLSLLACLTLASAGAQAEVGVTDTEVVIGGHTTESGPLAANSTPAARAGTAYYDMINEKGGINGRKIKWLRKDSQSLAPKTVEAIRQLVEQDKAFAVVGSNGPSHVAVVKYLNEHSIPDFYFSDGAGVYADPSLKMTFPAYYSWDSEGAAGAAYVTKHMKGKKVCFLQTKDTLGEELIGGAQKAFAAWNAKASDADKIVIGPTERVDRAGNQADSEVLNFKQAKCDVIMTSVYGPLCSSAINYGFNQGFKPKWIISSYNVNNKFVSLLAEGAAEGIVSAANVAREKSLVKNKKGWDDFEALMNKNGVPISGISATGYTLAEVFVETLRRAGKNLTREGIVKAAESFDGTWQCSLCLSKLKSSPTNHWIFGPPIEVVVKNKEWHFVD